MAFRSFEDLEVWKRACRLSVDLSRKLDNWQDFWFRNQIQRASVSIPSNIAEGSERGGKDFVRFLRIASGSAAELRTQLYIAGELGRLSADDTAYFVNETKEIARMITGLAKSLKTAPSIPRLPTEN